MEFKKWNSGSQLYLILSRNVTLTLSGLTQTYEHVNLTLSWSLVWAVMNLFSSALFKVDLLFTYYPKLKKKKQTRNIMPRDGGITTKISVQLSTQPGCVVNFGSWYANTDMLTFLWRLSFASQTFWCFGLTKVSTNNKELAKIKECQWICCILCSWVWFSSTKNYFVSIKLMFHYP